MPDAGAGRKKLGDIFFDSFFQYSITFLGASFVTGLEILTGTIAIQSDADFICVHSMYETGVSASGLAAAPAPPTLINGGILVKITDGATNRDLTNLIGGVPATSLFGSAQRPYMWPLTHRFRANTPITFQVTGQGAAPTGAAGLTFRLTLGGFKVPLGTI